MVNLEFLSSSFDEGPTLVPFSKEFIDKLNCLLSLALSRLSPSEELSKLVYFGYLPEGHGSVEIF